MIKAPTRITASGMTGIEVIEKTARKRRGCIRCEIDKNITFTTEDLESYLFAVRDPVVYDMLLLAASVEFADKRIRRPQLTWQRQISLNVPVYDVRRWSSSKVSEALHLALNFLTGDLWEVTFYQATRRISYPQQGLFNLPSGIRAVMPFSDGLDSKAASGLMALTFGNELLRVRLGKKDYGGNALKRPFKAIPYKVTQTNKGDFVESSARSRGFKFAVISSLAAYLAKAGQIIVSESGQGALGPPLVTVGQSYGDYRNHPLYLEKIEHFVQALLEHTVRFQYPRLWFTKAETLREFINRCDDGSSWADTKSCWQQNRHSSADGAWRHCGICAACILRRLSVHAAGLTEHADTYIWENLAAPSFETGATSSFDREKITKKMRQYAIAGILHMDHLAGLRSSPANAAMLDLTAFKLSRSLGLPQGDARANLDRFLGQHEKEWKAFIGSLGRSAFVTKWAVNH